MLDGACTKPLKGIVVIDAVSGPLALLTWYLGELGAEVVRVVANAISDEITDFAENSGKRLLNGATIADHLATGGFEVALACDLIIESEGAVFALPELKVGLAALAGGLLRLPRQIGLKRAMGMILTGRSVSAAEGKALSFMHEVIPADRLTKAARDHAETLLALSPMSLRASKQIAQRCLDEPVLADTYKALSRLPAAKALFRFNDSREGPLAFAQKRQPKWTGR